MNINNNFPRKLLSWTDTNSENNVFPSFLDMHSHISSQFHDDDDALCGELSRMRINEGQMGSSFNGNVDSVGSSCCYSDNVSYLEQWRLTNDNGSNVREVQGHYPFAAYRPYSGDNIGMVDDGMDCSGRVGVIGDGIRRGFMQSRVGMDADVAVASPSYYVLDDGAGLRLCNEGVGGLGGYGVSFRGRRQGGSSENRRRSIMDRGYRVDVDGRNGNCGDNGNGKISVNWSNLLSRYSLAELKGYIYLMAKDQSGCRLLKKMLDEGCEFDVIFDEIVHHIVELMLNCSGSDLVKKLLEMCNEKQMMKILLEVTKVPGKLVVISLDSIGTHVVQKLIKVVRGRSQTSLLVSALEPGFLDLVINQKGKHILQSCLECLSNEDNEFIFQAATEFCVPIATHQHGCCILQKYIDYAAGENRDNLVNEISANGLHLALNPYGNYVVQFIIGLKSPLVAAILNSQFQGNYVLLSVHKYGSHVVEKCLVYLEDLRSTIVQELVSVPKFDDLIEDPFANYVVKVALTVTKGRLRASLVHAVQSHKMICTNQLCRRIFSSINLVT